MSEDAYAEALKRVERPPAPAHEPEEPEMPPVSTAAATRVVYIERFVDPPNPYLPAEERNELDVAYRELGARFGFARRVAVSPAGDVVCAFAELDAAERCVRALHGRRVKGRQLCADFLREDDDDGSAREPTRARARAKRATARTAARARRARTRRVSVETRRRWRWRRARCGAWTRGRRRMNFFSRAAFETC